MDLRRMQKASGLILLAIVGCSGGGRYDVEQAVKGSLKDPDSAKFESVLIAGSGDDRVACGLVNAKNAMGGYAGATPFMLHGRKLYMSSDEREQQVINTCCGLYSALASGGTPPTSEDREACSLLPEPINT